MVDIDPNDKEQLRAYFNSETARLVWSELERFYAQGVVLSIARGLSLVDVAVELAQDNKEQFEQWIAAESVTAVSEQQAREWHAETTELWTVVAAPWVLVQEQKSP